MKGIEENFIDKKLRDKVSEGDFPFQELDWNALEPRLNKARNIFYAKNIFKVVSIISIAGFGIWGIAKVYKIGSLTTFADLTSKRGLVTPKHPVDSLEIKNKTSKMDISDNTTFLANKAKTTRKELIKPKHSVDSLEISYKNSMISISDKVTFEAKKSNAKVISNRVLKANKFSKIKKPIYKLSGQRNIGETIYSEKKPDARSEQIILVDSLARKGNAFHLPEYSLRPLIPTLKPNPFKKVKARKDLKNKSENYWAIAALVAPDANGVNSVKASQVALSVGFQVGYHLSDRWKVNLGVQYGPKIYKATQSDYQNSAFASNSYNNIQSINANCKVLDIPIQIGYSFYKKYRSQFYINAGLSTYFMRKETYTFNPSPTNLAQNPSYSYSIAGKNKNLLGVLDFVLDYRYRLSDRASFGMSPYLKLPLSGVGQGQLNLISIGTSVSINYNFGKSP